MIMMSYPPIRLFLTAAAYLATTTHAQLFHHWSATDKFLIENGDDRDRLGVCIEILGDTIVVGADGDDDRGSTAGSAYVYRKRGNHFEQTQKLLALDGDQNDIFGSTISLQPNVIAIGAPQHNELAPDAGAVYIFRYDEEEDKYKEAEKLLASVSAAEGLTQNFGFSVELLDNTTLLVGAPGDANDTGAFYIFRDEGSGTFTEQESYRPPDGNAGQRFGNSISASEDYAVIGSFHDDDNGVESGSAYIYKTNDGGQSYSYFTKLVPEDGLNEDEYGYSTAISNTTIAIGAHLDNDNFIGQDAGSVYIYTLIESEWTLETKLTRTTILNRLTGGAENEFFGFSLSLDGDKLAIGAPGADTFFADNAGVAYIYRKRDRGFHAGEWRLEDSVNACEPPEGDNFGYSVALDVANNRLGVGALEGGGRNNAEENPGAAFVYQRYRFFSFRYIRQLLCRLFY